MSTVVFPLKLRMTSPAVGDLQDALQLLIDRGLLLKGDDVAKREVAAALKQERVELTFGAVTRRAVAAFQDERHLEGKGEVDEKTADAINALLRDLGVPANPPAADQRRIVGVVVLEHGGTAAKLPLRLHRRAFGAAGVKIADAETGDDGVYLLAYPAAGAEAGLEIRAVGPDRKQVALTGALFDLGERAEINLVAPAALQPLQPEYDRLAADLAAQVGGDLKALGKAQETEDQQDLSLLNRVTGWDARLIALAAQASALSTDGVGLPTATLYALMRTGLPREKRQLALVSADVVGQALTKAVAAGIVQMTDAEIADARKKFDGFALEARLAMTAPGSQVTYGALLKASGLADDAQKKFAAVFVNHRGTSEELWKKAAGAGVADKDINALQQQGKLAFLTLNSDAVTGRLQALGIKDPAQLVDHDLHKPEAWAKEIQALAGNDDKKLDALIPPAYVGTKVKDRLEAYTADLARKVRIAYPTQVVARTIEQDAADSLKLGGARASTALLLRNSASNGFRLGATPVQKFIAATPAAMQGIPVAQRQAAMRGASTLQRVYQITPSNEAMTTLMSLGLTSAYDVVAMSEDLFVDRYAKHFTTVHEARLVHRKSRQVSSVTYNLFTIAKKLDNEAPVYSLSPAPDVKVAAKNELIKQFPTMESLFGSMDFCACDHCRSVLSPAAYLVDLLQFIDPEPLVWGNFLEDWKLKHGGVAYGPAHKKPYDALTDRRPDLPYIALTCENTNTAMPHIDIVNEILEYYVSNGALDKDAANDTGRATTPELLAEPQNIIAEAYDTVRQARYPLTLPFDLWLETARKFCEYFETPFAQVLESLRAGDELVVPAQVYDRAAIFYESLGLTPSELTIFTDPNPLNAWFQLYGYANAALATTVAVDAATGQRTDLNAAKALSRRLGVTYNELTDIIRTGFVNPKLASLVVLYKLDVTVQDVFFYKGAKAFFDANKDLLGAVRAALGAADQARFDALTPADWTKLGDVDAFEKRLAAFTAAYPASGINVKDWLNNEIATNTFDNILILADPNAGCDFDQTTVRYAGGQAADPIAFLKINLFVRLWRKLGWTIEETDRALQTFIPQNAPFDAAHLALAPLKTALIGIAHLKTLDARIRAGRNSRVKLLTLWSAIGTTGRDPLYAQLFLTRGVLKNDAVFDDPLGRYLNAPAVKVKDHVLALQGALGLTADDVRRALEDAGQDPLVVSLSIDSVSIVYRYALLAKALKLTVRELIVVKQLANLDPFKPLAVGPLAVILDDYPFSQTLAFVDIVEWFKDLGLKVTDVEYLLRHQFDAAGPLRPDAAAALALVKTLSEGIRAIQGGHAVPADPGGMSDDTLKQKLGLALPSDVVDRFLAMLNNTSETTVTRTGVAAADQLKPEGFAGEASIREVRYNAARQEQTLTFRGVLFDAQKNDLKARLPLPVPPAVFAASAVLSAALDDVQAQQRAFFAKFIHKTAPAVEPASGFLDAADFDLLFAPPAAGLTDTQLQTRLGGQRTRLATAFLPYLQQRLTRQLILETMTAQLGAEPALVESLLSNEVIVGDPDPLLTAFTATAERGLTATFYASTDGTGAALATATAADGDTSVRNTAGNPIAPAAMRSARFEGYLEVPAAGAYRFFVVLDKQNAEADLRFDHLSGALLSDVAANDGDEVSEFLELRPGVLYRFGLDLRKLNGGGARLLVQGETLPKDHVRQLALYPEAGVARASGALVLARKILQIVQSLGLTERELLYFCTHAAAFDNLDLSALPVQIGDDSLLGAQALFKPFARLAAYARLKRDIADGTDDLIAVFEAPDAASAYARIAALTRRETAVVKDTAETLWAAPALTTERPVRRVWDALQIVERFGVPVTTMAGWTKMLSAVATPAERFAIARGVKEAIKARFDPDGWQRIVQPIFDALRQRQRDALVAYVMQKNNFSTREQLYEYFLIDPGMEPVVQTSRIRLALGAVQLFIQRCLLNLEKNVPPGALNAKQWEWMARYRVWEANRKIFLFPENWLEPEFRDDKTHLFAELEGTLLQGDVSSDLVEDAFLNYLQKLDELARLELVALHLEDNPDPALRTLHVFGRTHGSPHKYFYRRYVHQTWTAWGPVAPKIDGDHLAPVIWRDRLYLFWVTFEFRASQPAGDVTVDPTATITFSPVMREVDMQLHWAALLQGEWTTPEFSDPMTATKRVTKGGKGVKKGKTKKKAKATQFVTVPVTVGPDFNPSSVLIHVKKEPYEDGEERGVFLHLGGEIQRSFYLAGRNSTPYTAAFANAPANPYSAKGALATRYAGSGALKVTFTEQIVTEAGKAPVPTSQTPGILAQGGAFTILPCDNTVTLGAPDPADIDADNAAAVAAAIANGLPEIATLIKPFFYQDQVTTLFVQPDVEETTVEQWDDWVTLSPPSEPDWRLPRWWDDLVVVPGLPHKKKPIPVGPDDYFPQFGGIYVLPETPQEDWLTNSFTGVLFKGEVVGRGGLADTTVLPVATGAGAFAGRGVNVAGGVNVVKVIGSGGLNGAMPNISDRNMR